MRKKLLKTVRRYYNRVVNSIAFYPAVIALVFLILSYIVLTLDFSEFGKELKSQWDFLSLKDASTARTIAATIAAGILSLTVFSFSMVMILLNQAASNMSNRVLGSLIGNRFQQYVLGFYIGTIVYALFLLSTIRDIDSGIYVPALSVYLLIVLTVVDIFLFIYFIHYITQSVKFETIIARIHQETKRELENNSHLAEESMERVPVFTQGQELKAEASGYFQGFDRKELLRLCKEQDISVGFVFPVGTYVLEGVPFLKVSSLKPVTDEQQAQIRLLVDFYRGESISNTPYYGFKQLVEVALKALSPGVNDPGTAVLSLHALVDLLAFRLRNFAYRLIKDEDGVVRIVTVEDSFRDIFMQTLLPMWDYGQSDRVFRTEMKKVLDQLHVFHTAPEDHALIEDLRQKVKQKIQEEA
ncbi:DUF2254 domain-containing protein [Rufibacter roseus]|uniref:DUF2254 domain-containing protein n=1 Tax=Rufibacter roseus TaxID=1567108 RepID=A0ABW2DKP5_9BACT|nr:DUF2254 domain-containing protein [Rufibacter roseus]